MSMVAAVAEPWFNEQAAGLVGGLAGWLAPKGVAKGLMLGIHWAFLLLGAVALVAGLVALTDRQPWQVWYVLALPGGWSCCCSAYCSQSSVGDTARPTSGG